MQEDDFRSMNAITKSQHQVFKMKIRKSQKSVQIGQSQVGKQYMISTCMRIGEEN